MSTNTNSTPDCSYSHRKFSVNYHAKDTLSCLIWQIMRLSLNYLWDNFRKEFNLHPHGFHALPGEQRTLSSQMRCTNRFELNYCRTSFPGLVKSINLQNTRQLFTCKMPSDNSSTIYVASFSTLHIFDSLLISCYFADKMFRHWNDSVEMVVEKSTKHRERLSGQTKRQLAHTKAHHHVWLKIILHRCNQVDAFP